MASAEELATWLNGTATGGPNSDGRYPMTDLATGTTYLVYCPAAQALNPALSEQPIEVFANTASAAATSASEDAAAADQARIDAQTYAANAAASATTANTHKNAAATSAANALTAENNAELAETNAETAQAAAETARNKAQDWADKAVDTEVETGKYSARHWAQKAADSAASVSMGNYYTKTEADAKFMLLPDTTSALALDNDYADIPKHLTITNYGAADASVPVGFATLITFNDVDNRVAQFAVGSQSSEFYWRGHRTSDAGWQPWRKLWHDGNLANPMTTDTAQTVNGSKTFTSNQNIGDGTGSRELNFNVAAGGLADIRFKSNGANRWLIRKNAAAESGSNAGSDLQLYRYTDANAAVEVLSVTRSTGVVDFAVTPTRGGEELITTNTSQTITGTKTFDKIAFNTLVTRQMIDLWTSTYGIGIQNNTMYFRTNSPASNAGGFAWHRAGVHDVNAFNPGTGGTCLAVLEGTGVFRAIGEIQSQSSNAFRMISGNYGAFWRNDGANVYLLLTASGDQYGSWNALRPFAVNTTSGAVTIGNGMQVSSTLTTNGEIQAKGNIEIYYSTTTGGYNSRLSVGQNPTGTAGDNDSFIYVRPNAALWFGTNNALRGKILATGELDWTTQVRGVGSTGGVGFVPTNTNVVRASFYSTGAYGGGYVMIDGSTYTGMWTQNDGTMRFGVGSSSGLTEAIRISNGQENHLTVNGRMEILHNNASSGIWHYTSAGARKWFHGVMNDTTFGLYNTTNSWVHTIGDDGRHAVKNANSATLTTQPRIFVQSTDPGAAAADGDIWIQI